MAKKTGLGDNPLRWITDTSQASPSSPPTKRRRRPSTTRPEESGTSEVLDLKSSEVQNLESSKPQKKQKPAVQNLETAQLRKFETSKVPKFQTFEVQLSVRLREDQLTFLEKLVRTIMTHRDRNHRKERITKNTILRVVIDALKDLDIDLRNIPDETELLRRIKTKIQDNDTKGTS